MLAPGSGAAIWSPTMYPFVHQQNLLRFRRLLADPADEAQREQLLRLIAEEEAKLHPPAPEPERHAA
jgi:hypothetical protein